MILMKLFNFHKTKAKGVETMQSIYIMCKKLIETDKKKGTHVMTMTKLDVYLANDRLTSDEYEELVAMMGE